MEVNGREVTATLLVKNGLIADGTGRVGFKGSIAIRGKRIVDVGDVVGFSCAKIIDADGLVVSPGFIDAHSHADKTLFLYPAAHSFVMQGVTTTVGGNCGNTAAPMENYWPLNMFWDLDAIYELRPFKYSHKEPLLLEEFKLKAKELYSLDLDWGTFAEFLARLERERLSVNHVPLVGHNTIRTEAMGADYERKPSATEMDKMKRMVAEAMDAGAFGLSTGLDYIPGVYADTAEIVELVEVVKDYGGIYATHLRSTGTGRGKARPPANTIEGINEAVEIGRRTGVPVQISHLLPGYRVDPPPPRQLLEAVAQATLAVIETARGEGVDVTFDVIPNVTGGTLTATDLVATLAPWLRETGSPQRLAESLRAKDFCAEITQAISSGKWPSLNSATNPCWMDNLIITRCKVNGYAGRTIGEIARRQDSDPLDTLFGIITKDPAAKMRSEFLREEAVITFLKHPAAMVGLDTYTFDTDWQMKYPPYYLPHPNTYGGFPRYLRQYVNELQVMSLEEAINKATYAPAKRFGLKERGVLAAGAYADIVLFDKTVISERGDEVEPRQYPQGIKYVIINGQVVVEEGRHTGARPGQVLRMR